MISFLATQQILKWKIKNDNTQIELPAYNSNKIKAPYGYVIKIEDFGR